MSRKQPDLTINGLVLPAHAVGKIVQEYSPIGGFSTMRLGAGTAIRQARWRKLATTLSASGLIPPGTAAINWDLPVVLGCVEPRSIQSVSPVITLPAARRSDAAPYALAVADDGRKLRATPVSVAGDVATLDVIAGASAYLVYYYPLLTVLSDGPTERFDAQECISGWDLQAEEV